MKENTFNSEPIVYLLQEVPGTKIGRPKYNIIGAQKFGEIKVRSKSTSQFVAKKDALKSVSYTHLTLPTKA